MARRENMIGKSDQSIDNDEERERCTSAMISKRLRTNKRKKHKLK